MELKELTKLIISKAILVHKELGSGLYEEVYQECLHHELSLSKLLVLKEVNVPVCYKGVIFNHAYKAPLLVSDTVVVELKAQEQFTPCQQAQLLTYLRFLSKPLGLLINFNNKRLVDGIVRLINQRVFPSAHSGVPQVTLVRN